eukprot:CAMPEP_0170479130 /NCGR_PEP_ID=MMETSP0208-20121228/467_1 /TAXON_ID=197538 /ORGANISM="Strombidium inclinatum, Strain S3" /LENGTH=63 /DNA_ID=CAMNT_0010751475 /DNA_START=201 /DNA_END=393 /DNA_ORIENTATION=+
MPPQYSGVRRFPGGQARRDGSGPGKDLMQMGVAIENANGITKSYGDNQEVLVKAMVNQSMRIS